MIGHEVIHVNLEVMFGTGTVIFDVSCPFGLISVAKHSNLVRIFICQTDGRDLYAFSFR